MNGKTAKKLRQLVRHLQETGAIESKEWVSLGRRDRKLHREVTTEKGEVKLVQVPDETVWLKPGCGRAVYQQMKRRAKGPTPSAE